MGKPNEFAATKWLVDSMPTLKEKKAVARNGTEEEDRNHVADCWIDIPGQEPISLGVRRWGELTRHRDLRIRLHREGRPVEWAALTGTGRTYDWYLQYWVGATEADKPEFVLADINKMRKLDLFSAKGLWRERPMYDGQGESWHATSVEFLHEQGVLLFAGIYNRMHEGGGIETYLSETWPRKYIRIGW